jgi:hypothetical protein
MNLKHLALASAVAFSAGAVHAMDFTIPVTLAPSGVEGFFSGHYGATHTESGNFTDTFTFQTTNTSSYVDASLITIGFSDSSDIDFSSVSLNGQAFQLTDEGNFEYAVLPSTLITGDLTLTVTGQVGNVATAGQSVAASYGGTINLAPVPEPETYALMLAGLGVVGWMARRRRAD